MMLDHQGRRDHLSKETINTETKDLKVQIDHLYPMLRMGHALNPHGSTFIYEIDLSLLSTWGATGESHLLHFLLKNKGPGCERSPLDPPGVKGSLSFDAERLLCIQKL
jgi:hypothetical protein